jgi:hypothetical protein
VSVAGELDIYRANSEALSIMSGADVGQPQPATFNGIPVEEWPHVVLSPAFAPCLEAMRVRTSWGVHLDVVQLVSAGVLLRHAFAPCLAAMKVAACAAGCSTLLHRVIQYDTVQYRMLGILYAKVQHNAVHGKYSLLFKQSEV